MRGPRTKHTSNAITIAPQIKLKKAKNLFSSFVITSGNLFF
jgi:hypothetical protein